MRSGTQHGSREGGPRTPIPRKRRISVLCCPTCGHESPADGDWAELFTDHGVGVGDTTLGDRSVELRCPNCSTHLTTLPA